jgi:hypothetical protein
MPQFPQAQFYECDLGYGTVSTVRNKTGKMSRIELLGKKGGEEDKICCAKKWIVGRTPGHRSGS